MSLNGLLSQIRRVWAGRSADFPGDPARSGMWMFSDLAREYRMDSCPLTAEARPPRFCHLTNRGGGIGQENPLRSGERAHDQGQRDHFRDVRLPYSRSAAAGQVSGSCPGLARRRGV